MTTQRLPFPVPDDRAHYFVGQYADMHDLVEDLVVPDGFPETAATVLRTARELLRQSYYCFEFSTVAVMHSLIAVEIVLRDRLPGAGNKTLQKLIKQGADTSVLTARQAEYLDYGCRSATAWRTARQRGRHHRHGHGRRHRRVRGSRFCCSGSSRAQVIRALHEERDQMRQDLQHQLGQQLDDLSATALAARPGDRKSVV